tara:strand:+ start:13030 stop:14433 length:1404 start_codon:yes stop_codon:yes gene_type:complete
MSMEIPYETPGVETGIAFADAPVASATAGASLAERIDPYWASVWATGSQASWLSADQARRQVASGLGRLPNHLDVDEAPALEATLAPRNWGKRLNALSVLDSWRTVTGEQMAAITGDAELATGKSDTMSNLFGAGVADVGIFTNGLYNTRDTARATLYRPSRSTAFAQDIEPHLTYPEWVSVTGGHGWESGSQFDRHNLLATELGLRVAEMCEIGAVVGEKLSTWDLLAHTGAGFPAASGVKRAADATLIRTDGARVAVEITATSGPNFDGKVRRWAELLSNRRMADTGLVVMFVLAPQPDKRVRPGEMLTMVRKNIAAATRDYPGVSFDRVASRMFVANWQDWFPAPHRVDPSFFSLDAWRATGPADDLWERASVLDPFDTPFEPSDVPAAEAVLNNIAAIRSVPSWLRSGSPRELWPSAVKALGYSGIPVPAPSDSEGASKRPLGAAVGSASAAQPPIRLRARAA